MGFQELPLVPQLWGNHSWDWQWLGKHLSVQHWGFLE